MPEDFSDQNQGQESGISTLNFKRLLPKTLLQNELFTQSGFNANDVEFH